MNGVQGFTVGVPVMGSRDWLGGVNYALNLFKAVNMLPRSRRPSLALIFRDKDCDPVLFDLYAPILSMADLVVYVGEQDFSIQGENGRKVVRCKGFQELFQVIDLFFPVISGVLPVLPCISWIPDFQHKYLPQLFTREEIESRESQYERVAATAKMVVFSSQAAADDFKRFYPGTGAVVEILRFVVVPDADWFREDPGVVQARYGIDRPYMLCPNQFWKHKGHEALFKALHLARSQGVELSLVCTGSTRDYRNQGYFKTLCSMLQDLGIEDQVKILGSIPRADQMQLMRACLAVVQPSLFEGWSTVVEEAKLLGKPILLSDIAVHREQNPKSGYYFHEQDPVDLKDTVLQALDAVKDGYGVAEQKRVFANGQQRLMEYAMRFSLLMQKGRQLFAKPVAQKH